MERDDKNISSNDYNDLTNQLHDQRPWKSCMLLDISEMFGAEK